MDVIQIILSEEWALRALSASLMVGLTCGVLGCFIVLRNMAMIGDALSHAVLPGVVVAFILLGYNILGFFVGSVIAGLITAVGITWIQQNVKTKNDAAIGIVFTAMFSLGVMGISWISKNEGVHLDLKDFLFGNVLGVSNQDLWLTLAISIYVLVSIAIFYRYLFVSTFQPTIAQTMGISVKVIHYFLMLLLSFSVVAALQTVGVILVVAMLITPASTALLLSDRLHKVLVIAGILGMFSAALGLFVAILINTTPGPAMAVVSTILYLLAAFFAPKKGLLFRILQKQQLRFRIKQEDFIKEAYKLHQKDAFSLSGLQERLELKKGKFNQVMLALQQRGYFDRKKQFLTEKGKEEAIRLTRAHRLWETYMVREMGLNEAQIHDEAERLEHLLPEEILNEVDKKLGYPTTDPHGSPIPGRKGLPEHSLAHLAFGSLGKIAIRQVNEQVASQLWQMGILPDQEVQMVKRDTEMVEVSQNGKIFQLPMDFAAKVSLELHQN
jgi:ABC-type Mn2+/Zn2+ transport system permease subunit/Mn-dependent DtxR family transcriptional regulator/Fe2+ transport system protein FeoA